MLAHMATQVNVLDCRDAVRHKQKPAFSLGRRPRPHTRTMESAAMQGTLKTRDCKRRDWKTRDLKGMESVTLFSKATATEQRSRQFMAAR